VRTWTNGRVSFFTCRRQFSRAHLPILSSYAGRYITIRRAFLQLRPSDLFVLLLYCGCFCTAFFNQPAWTTLPWIHLSTLLIQSDGHRLITNLKGVTVSVMTDEKRDVREKDLASLIVTGSWSFITFTQSQDIDRLGHSSLCDYIVAKRGVS